MREVGGGDAIPRLRGTRCAGMRAESPRLPPRTAIDVPEQLCRLLSVFFPSHAYGASRKRPIHSLLANARQASDQPTKHPPPPSPIDKYRNGLTTEPITTSASVYRSTRQSAEQWDVLGVAWHCSHPIAHSPVFGSSVRAAVTCLHMDWSASDWTKPHSC